MLQSRSLVLALSLIAVLLPASDAQSTTALFLTDAEQAGLSTAGVISVVGPQRVEFDETLKTTMTKTSLDVLEVLYGAAPPSLEIEQIGGRLGDRTVSLPGDASLQPGELCVLFLFKDNQGWYLTALQQSKYVLSGGQDGIPLLSRQLGDGIVRRASTGELVPFNEDERRSTSSLKDFRALLSSLPRTEVREQ